MFRRLCVSILTSLILLLSVGLASSRDTNIHGYAFDDQTSIGTFWVANRYTALLPNPYDNGTTPKRHIPRGGKMKAISAFKNTATGNYIQVNHQGVIGWVEESDIVIDSGGVIAPTEGTANGVRYSIKNVNNWASLRSTSSTQSDRLAKVPLGAVVFTTGQKIFSGGLTWLSVDYNGLNGWIPTKFLRKGGDFAGKKPVKPGSAYPVGEYRIVNVDNWASMRSQANRSAGRIRKVPRGQIVFHSGERRRAGGEIWLRVDLGGSSGWIPTQYLSLN